MRRSSKFLIHNTIIIIIIHSNKSNYESATPQLSQSLDKNNVALNLFKFGLNQFSFIPLIIIVLGFTDLIKQERSPEVSLNNSVNELGFNTTLTCTRHDVDPCVYATNGAFAYALVAELNSVVNGCPAPTECGPNQCCTGNINVNFLTKYNGINPWIYCSSRTDCDPYDCGSFGTMCNYADVVLQDSMLSTARTYANNHKGCATRLRNMQFYIVNFGDDCAIIDDCYNIEIYFYAEFYSCNCE